MLSWPPTVQTAPPPIVLLVAMPYATSLQHVVSAIVMMHIVRITVSSCFVSLSLLGSGDVTNVRSRIVHRPTGQKKLNMDGESHEPTT